MQLQGVQQISCIPAYKLHRAFSCQIARRVRLQRGCQRCRALTEQEQQQQQNQESVRKWRALASTVVESSEGFPEPAQSDFWEGDHWEWLGKLAVVAVPLLLVGTLILGTLAAATYNEGASQYIKSATEDKPAQIVDAQTLAPPAAAPAVDAQAGAEATE